jgi:hypothetical protein
VAGPAVRAEGTPPPDNTDFCRESFGPLGPAQRGVDTGVRPQRLLTSCAHRLGKPHRTNKPLTPSVAARVPSSALLAERSPLSGPLRDVHREGRARPARDRDRHGWFRTMATTGTRTPSIGSILDLAIEAGWPALPLTFARACPAPVHPPRISPSVKRSRHVRLTRHRAASLWPASAAPRRCVYQLLQPTSTTSTLSIARFSNHRSPWLSPWSAASTPPARPKPWQTA